MRNPADVNAKRTAFREHARSNGANIRMPRLLDAPEVRRPEYFDISPHWKDLFLPRKESRLMVDEAVRTNGIFVPYPLLAIMLTLTLVLGGGLIGLYATVTTMNSTMLMRDADQKEAIKELKNQLQLQEMYTRDIRETLAARGELKKSKVN